MQTLILSPKTMDFKTFLTFIKIPNLKNIANCVIKVYTTLLVIM